MSRPGYVNYNAKDGTPRQQMLDALCRRLGLDTSHRSRIAAIDAAVSAAVMCEKVQGEDEMRIVVEFSEDGLFGQTDPVEEGINVEDSVSRFIEALEARLVHDYPKAEIEVFKSINDRATVNGDTDHEECPWIDQAIEQVWNGDEWLTHYVTP